MDTYCGHHHHHLHGDGHHHVHHDDGHHHAHHDDGHERDAVSASPYPVSVRGPLGLPQIFAIFAIIIPVIITSLWGTWKW